MGIEYVYPEFEVIRNEKRCIACRVCERQCANGVHSFDPSGGVMISDESKCVNCQRCVSLCPTRALKIVKNDCALRENANWTSSWERPMHLAISSENIVNAYIWPTDTARRIAGSTALAIRFMLFAPFANVRTGQPRRSLCTRPLRAHAPVFPPKV